MCPYGSPLLPAPMSSEPILRDGEGGRFCLGSYYSVDVYGIILLANIYCLTQKKLKAGSQYL